jgi:phosphodiesterase/alkaline phosphatase D-like protein
MSDLDRRTFLGHSTAVAAGLATSGQLVSNPPAAEAAPPPAEQAEFASDWHKCHDRVWLGPNYWSNPLQDWRLHDGRIECIHAALDRNVQLLTYDLDPRLGKLQMSVRIGRVAGGAINSGQGSAGFRIGAQGPLQEYRNNAIYGVGINAGFTAQGGLFIGDVLSAKPKTIDTNVEAIELRLSAEPTGTTYTLALEAHDPASGKLLGRVTRENLAPEQLVGNLALVANFGRPTPGPRGKGAIPPAGPGADRFWFADWQAGGGKFVIHPEREFGPILFNHYTLSGGIMKMTAQMPPLGPDDSTIVRLETKSTREGDSWQSIAEATIHPEARTATFRVEQWPSDRDVPYRLAYTLRNKTDFPPTYHYYGNIRRDPVDKPVLTVADVSCNIHAAFPNELFTANMARLNPDLIAFVGDQFYESTGGYGVVQKPLESAILDYLRKWYIHGWTWRHLTRDRPSVSLPDDHDVYQGNIWGESGGPRHGTQEMGGYDMPAEWVNVVHRTQTSHHPDPYDPTPIRQNISVYYGPLTYGRVSFAVIADRMFKTGPEGKVPPTGGRGDHVKDEKFDPRTADLPGLELLGEGQMKFLRQWASDWRGADMKAVISQTIFTAMASTHGGNRERLRADYDANGWPQTPRNNALREIRKAVAVHIAGDQHLPAVVHYGIDEHRDGPVAFAGPAVNVGYPRWWEPTESGQNRAPDAPENTGDFLDHFGNRMTVLAVANGAIEPRKSLLESVHDKASGLGLVRFDKQRRTVTFECWPYLAHPQGDQQFPGWPVTVNMLDHYGRRAVALLPTLEIRGLANPVVQVIAEPTGEIVYTLRIAGTTYQPRVFAPGKYTVRVIDPETSRSKEVTTIEAAATNSAKIQIDV